MLVEQRRQTRELQRQTALLRQQSQPSAQAGSQPQIGDRVRTREYGRGNPYVCGHLVAIERGVGYVKLSSGQIAERPIRNLEVVPR